MNEIDPLAEIDAMRLVAQALQPLDEEGRRRVIGWAGDKFLGATPAKSVAPARQTPGSQNNDAPVKTPVGEPSSKNAARTANDFQDLAEFYRACSPSGDAEKALVVGTWIQQAEKIEGLDSYRVNTELKHLGYGIGNITRAFEYLMAARPAFMLQLRKAGTSRQARKTYRVTDAGLKRVSQMIEGNPVV